MIALSLPSGDGFGWGVAGDNIRRELAKITEIREPFNDGYPHEVDEPVFHAIEGHTFRPMDMNIWSSNRNVGYCFIEEYSKSVGFVDNAKRYFDLVCGGSSWGRKLLEDMGVRKPGEILQGIDPEIFYPDDFIRPPKDKFVVFSGGKAEFRKGQDIVIEVIKRFMQEHKDVHLVTAWANPWPQTMLSLQQSPYIRFPNVNGGWDNIVRTMLLVNNVPMGRVTILPGTPNKAMADIYRGCHVGLWPNRCEAGTNLPLMESIACGLPAIATNKTGHADLIPYFYRNIQSTECGDRWCEPKIETALLWLEEAYQIREELFDIGCTYAKDIREDMTWERTARSVMGALTGK